MFNKNTGYGQSVLNALSNAKVTGGQVFVVAKSAAAGRQILQEVFSVDPLGVNRFASTIDAAVGYCTASRGDVILVAPGHTETLSSATALVLDVAGISILGLGRGSLRPTITLDTATSTTIPVSAADISIENIIFTANFADITTLFTPTAKNFRIENCYIKATAANMNFLAIVDSSTTDNQIDGLEIINCEWIEPDLATLYMVKGDADIDRMVLKDNYLNLGVNTSDLPALVNMATGKDVTNIQLIENTVIRLNDANPLLLVTDTTTANSGTCERNFVRHLDTAGELLITAGTNIGMFDNKATAAVDASGYLLPAADS